MFWNAYRGRSVLVTGHTGFKGSWLSSWLVELGANVTGYSLGVPTKPSNFEASQLGNKIRHVEGDVLDFARLEETFGIARPEVVFHLAAQPIVRASFAEPKRTFDTNIGGTVNVLECIRASPSTRAAVMITSDKCYENVEWPWGYRETDRLGGQDPYSASKGAAEIVAHAYARSFLGGESARMATVRAGNVIGGGDWAADRVVPDCIRAWSEGREVVLRSPGATRPWQHVLEPLSGYLQVGADLLRSARLHGEAFNFGPLDGMSRSVGDVTKALASRWSGAAWRVHEEAKEKESTLLKLSIDKALHVLKWRPVLDFDDTIGLTASWYRAYYENEKDAFLTGRRQIGEYVARASKAGLPWAESE